MQLQSSLAYFDNHIFKKGRAMSDPTETSPPIRLPMTRLGVMMFLQFFVWGSCYVGMYGFLNNAGMTAIGPVGFVDAPA